MEHIISVSPIFPCCVAIPLRTKFSLSSFQMQGKKKMNLDLDPVLLRKQLGYKV